MPLSALEELSSALLSSLLEKQAQVRYQNRVEYDYSATSIDRATTAAVSAGTRLLALGSGDQLSVARYLLPDILHNTTVVQYQNRLEYDFSQAKIDKAVDAALAAATDLLDKVPAGAAGDGSGSFPAVGGASTFIELDDTFASYTGRALQPLRVNATANAIESFVASGGSSLYPPKNVVIYDPNQAAEAGRLYNTIAAALAFVITQTPSAVNTWGIILPAGVTAEGFPLTEYVTYICQGAGVTILTGEITSDITDQAALFRSGISGATIANIAGTAGKFGIVRDCDIAGGTYAAAPFIAIRSEFSGGDFSAAVGVFFGLSSNVPGGSTVVLPSIANLSGTGSIDGGTLNGGTFVGGEITNNVIAVNSNGDYWFEGVSLKKNLAFTAGTVYFKNVAGTQTITITNPASIGELKNSSGLTIVNSNPTILENTSLFDDSTTGNTGVTWTATTDPTNPAIVIFMRRRGSRVEIKLQITNLTGGVDVTGFSINLDTMFSKTFPKPSYSMFDDGKFIAHAAQPGVAVLASSVIADQDLNIVANFSGNIDVAEYLYVNLEYNVDTEVLVGG